MDLLPPSMGLLPPWIVPLLVARMPCPSAMRSDDLLAHAPAMTQLPLYAAQPSEPGRDSYFPTFKQSHSQIFDDTIFPDEVSPANRALENWIAGLFH